MAKTQTPVAGTPVGGCLAGLGGPGWIQSINEYLLDEHVMTGALGTLYHRPGSARPFYDTLANVLVWSAGLGVAMDNGRLGKANDGPLYIWNQAGGTLDRVVGGRYLATAPVAVGSQVIPAITFTTVTNFNIAAFNLNAGLDYRIRANAAIRRTAGLASTFGARVRITENGGLTYDYEQYFAVDASGYASINFDCLHTAVAGGNAAVAFQVWGNAGFTLATTLPALAGWTGTPNNLLSIMEI